MKLDFFDISPLKLPNNIKKNTPSFLKSVENHHKSIVAALTSLLFPISKRQGNMRVAYPHPTKV